MKSQAMTVMAPVEPEPNQTQLSRVEQIKLQIALCDAEMERCDASKSRAWRRRELLQWRGQAAEARHAIRHGSPTPIEREQLKALLFEYLAGWHTTKLSHLKIDAEEAKAKQQ